MEFLVKDIVDNCEVIDVHTHLFPPNHGDLMHWGIDSLLTYHYLVAEYFTIAPMSVTYESFFKLTQKEQADLVFEELFVKRSPISEGCRGVLTVLKELGLEDCLKKRDLNGMRDWFSKQEPAEYCEKVFEIAKVKYVVMTNIPFDEKEAEQWDLPDAKSYSKYFKAAVRVDPILKGDFTVLFDSMKKKGFKEPSVENAQEYLSQWADKMDAVYFMASTPSNFEFNEKSYQSMNIFETISSESSNEKSSELIEKVLIPVARKKKLPLALKLGAVRGENPDLNPCGGGDGVQVADLDFIGNLCRKYKDCKFLVTVLSRSNQHSLCVLAQKFRNLHIYGCWWYNNSPSIIDEICKERIEMLGSGFTIQHSDARVLDQLIYKWIHSKKVITQVLSEKYKDLSETGWDVKTEDIKNDVALLFGKAYENFLQK